jgi:hypothetical protein
VTRLSDLVLRRRRLVAGAWLLLAIAGAWAASGLSDALSQTFDAPGRPAFEANKEIVERFGSGVGNARVQITGTEALATDSGDGEGIGLLVEILLGGVGALVVLVVVFASWLALVPLVVAAVSILTTFLLLTGSRS